MKKRVLFTADYKVCLRVCNRLNSRSAVFEDAPFFYVVKRDGYSLMYALYLEDNIYCLFHCLAYSI